LENAIGRRDTLGFFPYCIIVRSCGTWRCWTGGCIHAEKEIVTGIPDIGTIGIHYLPLKVDLFIDASCSKYLMRRKEESSHTDDGGSEKKSLNCILDFYFHRNKKRAEDLVSSSPVSIYFLSSIHQNNGFVKVKNSSKILDDRKESGKERKTKKEKEDTFSFG